MGICPKCKTPYAQSVTVDALVFDESKIAISVLLIKRGRDPYKGKWALPGGFVEHNEIVEEAVLRELMEETGIQGKITGFAGVYSKPGRDPRGHTISLAFRISPVFPRNMQPGRAGDDAAKVEWWPVKKMPKLAFDHEEIINDWLHSRL